MAGFDVFSVGHTDCFYDEFIKPQTPVNNGAPVSRLEVPINSNNPGQIGDILENSHSNPTPTETPQSQQTPMQTPEQKAAQERLTRAKVAHAQALKDAEKQKAAMQKELKTAKEQKALVDKTVKELNEANGKLKTLDPKDPKSLEKAEQYLKKYKGSHYSAQEQFKKYKNLVKNYSDAAKRYNSTINRLKPLATEYNNAMQASRAELKSARKAVSQANKAIQTTVQTTKSKGSFWSRVGKGIVKGMPKLPLGITATVLTVSTIALGAMLILDDKEEQNASASLLVSNDESTENNKNATTTDTQAEVAVENLQPAEAQITETVAEESEQTSVQATETQEETVVQSAVPTTEQARGDSNVAAQVEITTEESEQTVEAEAEEVYVSSVEADAQTTEQSIKQIEQEFETVVQKGGCVWNIIKEYLKKQNPNNEPTDTQIANMLNQLMNDERIELTSTTNDVRTAVWAGQDKKQIYIHTGETVKIKPVAA